MRILPILPALAVLSLVTSCVAPPRAEVASSPPPVRLVAPRPSPPLVVPAALPIDWRDWPQTPGDWRYDRTSFGSRASFGTGDRSFTVECGNDRRIHLEATGAFGGAMTVRTSSLTRSLATGQLGDPPIGAQASLAANDPLLDAMGFSRGRFVVEQAGAAPFVLPAWAEVERVVEDCRG